ncbi:MAG: hypothetical protein RI891_453, partial [Gemmatimonadota bacterium]
MHQSLRTLSCAAALVVGPGLIAAQTPTPLGELPVIPAPASVTPGTGSWQPKGRLPVFLPEASEAQLGRAGITVRSTDSASVGGPEGYRLEITSRGVTITAARDAG